MRIIAVLTTAVALVAAAPALAAKAPAPPKLLKPSDVATVKKNPKGVTFYVRARANEKKGALGIQIATADDRVAADGRFGNPDAEESGGVPSYVLKPAKA